MVKNVIKSPSGIQYMSEWVDYDFPEGHVIVDKGVTGCGYTEYCLRNNLNIVLCSPRKLLLENKRDQHVNDLNILYLENSIEDFGDVKSFKNRIRDHIANCQGPFGGKPTKFLVTYDSTHYVIAALKELGYLESFFFIIDEFQSIFLDSYYKSEVEFSFVEYLQVCPNVLYLSATPMLDKYLKRVPEFMNLPFIEIDWSESGIVEKILVQRKFSRSLSGECIAVVKQYLAGIYPYTYSSENKLIQSTEAVFYFNSITDIIRVITKCELTPDQVNIICADTSENLKKLQRIGHDIGRIPLKGEPNKMFTFCTKTAYIGSDFHSTCASSYVFADPNLKCLALDISLDLPQIVGRQRDRDNPFKNNIVIFYKTMRKSDMLSKKDFDNIQEQRKISSSNILNGFSKLSLAEQKEYIKKLKSDITVSQYSGDFISISKNTNQPVYNSFIEIANERAWEVSQVDYQDKINVTKALENISSKQSDYEGEIDKVVSDFLNNYFNKTGVFKEKMKMYCEFMDQYPGNKELEEYLYYKLKDPKYRKYYSFYGTSGCRALSYEEKKLSLGILETSKDEIISSKIYEKFKVGERYSKKDIKQILSEIYSHLEVSRTPKSTDLEKYFRLERTVITDPQTKKKKEGYKLNQL